MSHTRSVVLELFVFVALTILFTALLLTQDYIQRKEFNNQLQECLSKVQNLIVNHEAELSASRKSRTGDEWTEWKYQKVDERGELYFHTNERVGEFENETCKVKFMIFTPTGFGEIKRRAPVYFRFWIDGKYAVEVDSMSAYEHFPSKTGKLIRYFQTKLNAKQEEKFERKVDEFSALLFNL